MAMRENNTAPSLADWVEPAHQGTPNVDVQTCRDQPTVVGNFSWLLRAWVARRVLSFETVPIKSSHKLSFELTTNASMIGGSNRLMSRFSFQVSPWKTLPGMELRISPHASRTQPHDHDHDSDGHCVPASQSGSVANFVGQGVRFQYPSDWTLSEESNDYETNISLQSDGTSFWTIMLLKTHPDPDEVLDTVVSAFENDYEDVDVVSTIDNLAGLPALGRDVDFVCYDLVNSAVIRAFQTSLQTVLVLYQGTDHELETTRTQLKAITDSLWCDDEDSDLQDIDD